MAQFTFECDHQDGTWIPAALGPSQFIVRTNNLLATLTTPLRTDCWYCADPKVVRRTNGVDQTTFCFCKSVARTCSYHRS